MLHGDWPFIPDASVYIPCIVAGIWTLTKFTKRLIVDGQHENLRAPGYTIWGMNVAKLKTVVSTLTFFALVYIQYRYNNKVQQG